MSICPCKGCQDREILCHANCEKYIAWKQENEEIKKKRIADNTLYRHHAEVMVNQINKKRR